MGNKEFHQMLGVLCDDDKLHEKFSQGDKGRLLKEEASKMGINLSDQDVNDLVEALPSIRDIKTSGGVLRSPRS